MRTLVFRDVGVDRRQFRDLMSPGLAGHRASARGQGAVVMATRVRECRHLLIHACGGHHRSAVSDVTDLAAGLPSALLAASPLSLLARETVGRGWFRGGRRILLPQRELTFQIRNASVAFGQFVAEPIILPLEALDLLRALRIGG